MILLALAWVALASAVPPVVMYLWNSWLFRSPPLLPAPSPPAKISVLIPARNEESAIGACLGSVLASKGIELEVVVLDDHSDDRTAEVVRGIAVTDSRVRLEAAPPLREGWCGKQHACAVLAEYARFPLLTFLDADVRLTPDALARMAAFRERAAAGLVSGFPRQETGTLLEKLVIPLIHWLLMGYLPMIGMRLTRAVGFGVGCGQWFLTTRTAYDAVGGHRAVKSSLHDGLTLPRAYRRARRHTDICDATDLATCRMYRSARQVWLGLAKNAREGLASTTQILFWTVALVTGQVMPFVLIPMALAASNPEAAQVAMSAAVCAYLPRCLAALRFRQSWLGAALHPVGVLVLLAIQWFAVYRAVIGRPVGWKGRGAPQLSSSSPPVTADPEAPCPPPLRPST